MYEGMHGQSSEPSLTAAGLRESLCESFQFAARWLNLRFETAHLHLKMPHFQLQTLHLQLQIPHFDL